MDGYFTELRVAQSNSAKLVTYKGVTNSSCLTPSGINNDIPAAPSSVSFSQQQYPTSRFPRPAVRNNLVPPASTPPGSVQNHHQSASLNQEIHRVILDRAKSAVGIVGHRAVDIDRQLLSRENILCGRRCSSGSDGPVETNAGKTPVPSRPKLPIRSLPEQISSNINLQRRKTYSAPLTPSSPDAVDSLIIRPASCMKVANQPPETSDNSSSSDHLNCPLCQEESLTQSPTLAPPERRVQETMTTRPLGHRVLTYNIQEYLNLTAQSPSTPNLHNNNHIALKRSATPKAFHHCLVDQLTHPSQMLQPSFKLTSKPTVAPIHQNISITITCADSPPVPDRGLTSIEKPLTVTAEMDTAMIGRTSGGSRSSSRLHLRKASARNNSNSKHESTLATLRPPLLPLMWNQDSATYQNHVTTRNGESPFRAWLVSEKHMAPTESLTELE